jgi:hypothetical protein
MQGIIDLTGFPQMVKQDGELQAPAAQVTIGSDWTQDVLGGTDKQAAQVGISEFCDAELGVLVTRLVTIGNEAQGGADIPALVEAIGVLKGEDISESGDWTHTADPSQQLSLWVVFATEFFGLLVIGFAW